MVVKEWKDLQAAYYFTSDPAGENQLPGKLILYLLPPILMVPIPKNHQELLIMILNFKLEMLARAMQKEK